MAVADYGSFNSNTGLNNVRATNQYAMDVATPYGFSQMPTLESASRTALANSQANAVHDPLEAAKLQNATQQQSLANQAARFNSVFGLLSGQLGKLGNGGVYTAGGTNTAPPPITAGPVLNPQQIQQQVNTSRAANDQATQSQMQRTNSSLAGRGFGANSPLAMALNNAAQGQNLATNTANETNTRLNAAQQNASQLLNSQQALSNQWATQNQLDIQRRQPYVQQQTALLQALAGLV